MGRTSLIGGIPSVSLRHPIRMLAPNLLSLYYLYQTASKIKRLGMSGSFSLSGSHLSERMPSMRTLVANQNTRHQTERSPPMRMLSTYENALHQSERSPPVWMLSTNENALHKWECSPPMRMFSTNQNARNQSECSPLIRTLTTSQNARRQSERYPPFRPLSTHQSERSEKIHSFSNSTCSIFRQPLVGHFTVTYQNPLTPRTLLLHGLP